MDEKEMRKIDEKKLKQAVKEYLERMMKIYKEGCGTSTDILLDCPFCGTMRGMQFTESTWKCLWSDCRCILPPELAPPSSNEIKEIMRLKKRLDFLEEWKDLLKV